MCEYTAYYESFSSGYWAHPEADKCLCHGTGWAASEIGTWHKCRYHYNSSCPHPEFEPQSDGVFVISVRSSPVIEDDDIPF